MPSPLFYERNVKLLKYTLLSLAASLIFWAGIKPGWERMQSDFPNYWLGSRLVLERASCDSLYHNDWFQDQLRAHGFSEQGKFSPFPPPTAYVFLPLAPFAPLDAKRIWMCVNILLLVLTVRSFHRISGWGLVDSAAWVGASGIALINNLYLGQVYVGALLLMLWGWEEFQRGRLRIAGILFGCVAAVKYFPAVMLPEWLAQGRWRILAAFFLTLAFFGLCAWWWPGATACRDFLERVVFAHLDGRLEGQSPFAPAFQSWNALFYQLFRFDPLLNPDPWFDRPWLADALRHGVPLVLLAIGLVQAWRMSKRRDHAAAVAILSLTLLAASPASASYHLLLILFPLALLLARDPRKHFNIFTMTGSLFLFLALMGWSPLIINKFLHPEGWPVVFQFHRLWLTLAIWSTVIVLVPQRR